MAKDPSRKSGVIMREIPGCGEVSSVFSHAISTSSAFFSSSSAPVDDRKPGKDNMIHEHRVVNFVAGEEAIGMGNE